MKRKNQFPQIIQSAILRIESFVQSRMKYSRPGKYRAMRTERASSLVILLTALCKKAVLCYDGIFCKVINNVCFPLTVADMTKISGLSQRNVQRCLHDLQDMNYLTASRQMKRPGEDGELEVGPVLRRLTEKFWRDCGLWSAFVAAVKYAVEHARVRLAWSFKKISQKTKALAAALAPAPDKVPKSDRQRQNAIFMQYLDCSSKHPGCLGSYASSEVCSLCRRMRTGGKA